MARRRKLTGFAFKPFSRRQLQLLNWWRDGSPYSNRFIVIADGAIRSGKTTAMIASFLQFTQESFKGCDFIIAGRSIGALKRNVINPMIKMLTAWGWPYEYNRSDHVLTIGANQYYMFGANTEKSKDAVQGMTAAGALLDEAAIMPKSFVEQCLGRCSVEDSKVFMNCNPAGPSHFIKVEYIDKADAMGVFHIHFMMDDNLTLSSKTKERYRKIFIGVFFQRYILGKWVLADGLIYPRFDNALEDGSGGPFVEYIVSMDYGTRNATAALLWGHDGKVWHALKEYRHSGRDTGQSKTDDEYYNEIDDWIGEIPVRRIIIDPSAASFITLIRKRGRYGVIQADNDVINGIRNTGTAISLGLIRFDKLLSELRKEFEGYMWDDKSKTDSPIKVNDHLMDALRYFVQTMRLTRGKRKSLI